MDLTELGRWVQEARVRRGTRKAAVERANALGGKISPDTWRKVERLAKEVRPGDDSPSDETLRAICLGVGADPDALISWRRGGPKPDLPSAPLATRDLAEQVADLRKQLARIAEFLGVPTDDAP